MNAATPNTKLARLPIQERRATIAQTAMRGTITMSIHENDYEHSTVMKRLAEDAAFMEGFARMANIPRRTEFGHDTHQLLIEWGFEIVGKFPGPGWNVRRPEGWVIEPTDDPAWTRLIDDEGTLRATICNQLNKNNRRFYMCII